MERINNLKQAHAQFTKAIKYLNDNEVTLKADPERWEKVLSNFKVKFEKPLDAAWKALTEEEKKRFEPLYAFRKAMQDELVQRIITMFDGEIISK